MIIIKGTFEPFELHELLGWEADARDLPDAFVSGKLLAAQREVGRAVADHAASLVLQGIDLDTPAGRREAAWLRSASGGPAGAFLSALPGGVLTMGDDMFVLAVWHRLRFRVPTDVPPPPCKCSAGVAAEPDHAMVCKKVAKETQMRHDNLARALRLVASYAGLQSALEPLYRALARGAGVELNRRGDVVVVMPRLEMAAVDVVVTHAPAASYVAAAARETGATAERAEDRKRDRFRRDVPDHAAFRFVPFAVESCGFMGKAAVRFVGQLGDVAAASGRISKGAFVQWALRVLSVSLQRGDADMYRQSGLVISREHGLRYDAGLEDAILPD